MENLSDPYRFEETIDIAQLLRSFLRHLPLAIGAAFAVALLGFIAASLKPKVYQASVLMQMSPSSIKQVLDPLAKDDDGKPMIDMDKSAYQAYEVMLTNPQLSDEVRVKMDAAIKA